MMRINKFLNIVLFSLFSLVTISANTTPTSSVDFYNGNIKEAQKKANDEGKLFFVDFYANWCAPCKWMDETTFMDKRVSKMLNNNFVSLKVDIDKFDGFELKQQYKVRYLPTILIFNAEGELIDRIEETLSAQKLITILNSHHTNNDATPKVVKANTSPSSKSIKLTEEEITTSQPTMPEDDFIMPNKSNYRVQVGIYSDFKNTFRYVNELKDQFLEPVIVLNDYKNEKIVYKIMIGEFKTQNEATSFVKILKNEFQIEGIVK